MTPLSTVQSDFFRYVLDAQPSMTQHVVGTARVDAGARLSIYGNAYRLRLVEALDANFPALHAWLGDEGFERLGRAYLAAYPSRHYSIRWFGHRLPEFMAGDASWRADGFACELAEFEWAMSEAFDATDADVVSLEQMASFAPDSWPRMRLAFHPSLRRLSLTWNVAPIWHALTHSQTPTAAQQTDMAATWIVWRQRLTLFYRQLDTEEAWALAAAVGGAAFAELCEGLCKWIEPEQVAARAAGYLRQWIADGLIIQLQT